MFRKRKTTQALLAFFLFAYLLGPSIFSASTAQVPLPSKRTERQLRRFATPLKKMHVDAIDQSKLRRAFHKLQRVSRTIQLSTSEATLAENREKNRSSTLFPYDKTRTCRHLNNFYINANDVVTPLTRYIVTQGPLEATVNDFWKMVFHEKVTLIVTLVMAQENGKNKCASFWTENACLTLLREEVLATKGLMPQHRIVLREFLVKEATTGKTRTVKQLHYENWPDGKTPDVELFVQFLDAIDSIHDQKSPIVVHCSAGIGRSGTLVAAHSLRQEIRKRVLQKKMSANLFINIPQAIFELRLQRGCLVGTYKQMQTVYQALEKECPLRSSPFFMI